MKKILALLLVIVLILGLSGCGTSYNEVAHEDEKYETPGNGYFTVIKEWGSIMSIEYKLIYANDTKVIYFYMNSGYGKDITPMYNADGTLQIYEGE